MTGTLDSVPLTPWIGCASKKDENTSTIPRAESSWNPPRSTLDGVLAHITAIAATPPSGNWPALLHNGYRTSSRTGVCSSGRSAYAEQATIPSEAPPQTDQVHGESGARKTWLLVLLTVAAHPYPQPMFPPRRSTRPASMCTLHQARRSTSARAPERENRPGSATSAIALPLSARQFLP